MELKIVWGTETGRVAESSIREASHASLRFMPTRHETGLRMTPSTTFNYEQTKI